MGTQEILATIFGGAYLIILNWLRMSVKALKDDLEKEKKQTVWRVDEIYKRVDLHKTQFHGLLKESDDMTHNCRKEIDQKIDTLMTESQVKDFVDRSLKPLSDNVNEVKDDVRNGNKLTNELISKVQILLDRQ